MTTKYCDTSIYDETQRPKSKKKKLVVRIRSPFLPFPSGTCKMCGKKHNPVFIPLEYGGSIAIPESAIPKDKVSSNEIRKKQNNLADLFWPSEVQEEGS